MLAIQINKVSLLIRSNLSVLEACKYAGIYIPRYCYHETLWKVSMFFIKRVKKYV